MTNTPTFDRDPDILAGAPTRGAGVRRLNRLPLFIVLGIVCIVVLVVVYTMAQRAALQRKHTTAAADRAPVVTTQPAALSDMPAAGAINPAAPPGTPGSGTGPGGSVGTQTPSQQPASPYAADWDTYRAAQAQADTARLQAAQSALNEGAEVQAPRPAGNAPTSPSSPSLSELASLAALGQSTPGASVPNAAGAGVPSLNPLAGLSGLGANGAVAQADPNGQRDKRAFFNNSGTIGADYLATTRTAPLSPFEMKAGTVIPAVMIGGVNSDLPGQLIAQVRENVYDTATGHHLLIPQGARLVGTYDNAVTYGQTRVLVAWTRIIYPDASSLDLGLMPGAEPGGYAGFHDTVNNHYLQVFSTALLMSLFSAGIQLSQPQATNGENINSTQIISGSVGLQLGELGMELAQRGLQVQPTLEIRPGYRFNIMVTKDVIIQPWRH